MMPATNVAGTDDGPLRRPLQKPAVDERVQDVAAVIGAEVPQPDRLTEREFETRQLVEVAANAVGGGCKIHLGVPPVRRECNGQAMRSPSLKSTHIQPDCP